MRMALTEKSLEECISVLIQPVQQAPSLGTSGSGARIKFSGIALAAQRYEEWAFILDAEMGPTLTVLLSGLSSCTVPFSWSLCDDASPTCQQEVAPHSDAANGDSSPSFN